MFSKENDEGVENEKTIIHANRGDVYMNKKRALIKRGYYVEVSGYDGRKFLWEVVDNHVVEEGKDFFINLFDKYKEGVER